MDKEKPICIFSQTLLPGGTEKQVVDISIILKKNQKVFIIILYPGLIDKKFKLKLSYSSIPIYELKGKSLHSIFSLIKCLKKNNCKILMCYLTLPGIFGVIAGKLAGVDKIIGNIRSCYLSKYKLIINRILHNKFYYKTIFNNKNGKDFFLKNGFIEEKAVLIENGIQAPEKVSRNVKSHKLRILSVGRFHPAKDYYTALNVIKKIREKGVEFKYFIIGYGKLEYRLRNWIEEFNLKQIIELKINPPNINYYYKNSDIYLQTSIYEGLSNTVMEAMSYSLPCCVSNVGDNKYLINNYVEGFAIEPKDINGFVDSLFFLINNPKDRIEMGMNAYKKIKNNYSLKKFENSYISFINSLI